MGEPARKTRHAAAAAGGRDAGAGAGDGRPAPRAIAPALARLVGEFVESRRSENTRRAYEDAIAGFLTWADVAGVSDLAGLDAADVARWRNGLQRARLAASTINQRLAALRGFFRWLMVAGRMARNPADPALVAGMRASQESRTEGLTVEEVRQVLAACDDGTLAGVRDRALVVTLYYEGLRRSEASKLNYRDISTRRGLLEVRDAKGSAYETVRLRPEVRAAIDGYLTVLGRARAAALPRPDDPVFMSVSRRSFGRRLAPSSINNVVKRRAKLAGIGRRITAHSLRHTTTTHALAAGVPLHQVQRHLRHRDVRTTLRYDRDREARRNPTTDAMPPLSE